MISSPTPEGEPQRCPICDKIAALEPSDPGGDWICPSCGSLFWRLQSRIAAKMGRTQIAIDLHTSLRQIDSLNLVELIMEFEEE